jgi:hypothetical protein
MGLSWIAKSQVSKLCEEVDDILPLAGELPRVHHADLKGIAREDSFCTSWTERPLFPSKECPGKLD